MSQSDPWSEICMCNLSLEEWGSWFPKLRLAMNFSFALYHSCCMTTMLNHVLRQKNLEKKNEIYAIAPEFSSNVSNLS